MRIEGNSGAGIHLPPTDYIHNDIEGKHVVYTTLRQIAKHMVGLDLCCHNGRLYTRHGKKYYRPYRNFFAGRNRAFTREKGITPYRYLETSVLTEPLYQLFYQFYRDLSWKLPGYLSDKRRIGKRKIPS